MDELSNVDLNMEPGLQPRSYTWPFKRPDLTRNIENKTISMALDSTIEENLQDDILPDGIFSLSTIPDVKSESEDNFIFPSLFPFAESNEDEMSEPIISSSLSTESGVNSSILTTQQLACDALNNNFIKLETMPPSNSLTNSCNYNAHVLKQGISNTDFNLQNNSANLDKQTQIITTTSDSLTITSPATSKPKSSSRKNAWGNLSYAEMITQAIESSPEKRLTLAQIYDWVVKNIPFFNDKGESNSSAGWKNSIRHNLSLHDKFKKAPNEGTGKSSWWTINYDAKPKKPHRNERRRTSSLESSNSKPGLNRTKPPGRKKIPSKKDLFGRVKSPNSTDLLTDIDSYNSGFFSDKNFRTRTPSNASSIGGRSPPKNNFISDLEPDGPPPPSQSSSYAAGTTLDFIGSNGNFEMMDNSGGLSNTDKVREGIQNLGILNSSPILQTTSDGTPIFYKAVPSSQQQQLKHTSIVAQNPSSSATRNFTTLQTRTNHGSTPNIRLLFGNNVQPTNKHLSNVETRTNKSRGRASTMSKLQPQPKYNMDRTDQTGEYFIQNTILFSTSSQPTTQSNYGQFQYSPQQQQQPQTYQQPQRFQQEDQQLYQQQQVFVHQQGGSSGDFFNATLQQGAQSNQTIDMVVPESFNPSSNNGKNYNQIENAQYQMAGQVGKLPNTDSTMVSDQEYPADLNNLDESDIFNPGPMDYNQLLQNIYSEDSFEMDLNSYISPNNNALFDGNNLVGKSPICKFETNNPSTYPFATNQVNNQPINNSQQSLIDQQHKEFKNVNIIGVRPGQMVAVIDGGCNGGVSGGIPNISMLLNDEMIDNEATGLSAFFSPQQVQKKQSSNDISSKWHE